MKSLFTHYIFCLCILSLSLSLTFTLTLSLHSLTHSLTLVWTFAKEHKNLILLFVWVKARAFTAFFFQRNGRVYWEEEMGTTTKLSERELIERRIIGGIRQMRLNWEIALQCLYWWG
jgi:hypothetical protein